MASQSPSTAIEYDTLVTCHTMLVDEIACDPKTMADTLFQHGFIAQGVVNETMELNEIKKDKARRLVDALQSKVQNYPEKFMTFLVLLREGENQVRHRDLLNNLIETYRELGGEHVPEDFITSAIGYLWESFGPLEEESNGFGDHLQIDAAFPEFADLPTVDDRGVVQNPFEHPPDESLVGEDIRATSGHLDTPSEETLKGKLLRAFQIGDFKTAEKLLVLPESESCDVKTIVDSDKKSLLHFCCHGDWLNWCTTVYSLIYTYDCDVSAVDEDGNTPLHVASQFGSEGMIKFLLSQSSCEPNSLNNVGSSPLCIALEKGHRGIVRALLSSGRVSPTAKRIDYPNNLPPLGYEGSSLQMVDQFVKCKEDNRSIQPPFSLNTCYCLLDIFRKLFKNRNSITIKEIVGRIERDFLPLPDDAAEIYKLMLEVQTRCHFFSMSAENGCPENVVISTTDQPAPQGLGLDLHVSPVSRINAGVQNSSTLERLATEAKPRPLKSIEREIQTVDNSLEDKSSTLLVKTDGGASNVVVEKFTPDNLEMEKSVSQEEESSKSHKHLGESVNEDKPDISKNDSAHDDSSDVAIPEEDFDPLLPAESSENLEDYDEFKMCKRILISTIIIVTIVFLSLFFLGVIGAAAYKSYGRIGTATVRQIQADTVTLLGMIHIVENSPVTFTELAETAGIPVNISVSRCDDISVEDKEIDDYGFFSSVKSRNTLGERYMLNGSSLTFNVNLTSNSAHGLTDPDCVAKIVVFNDLTQYLEFLGNQTWSNSYVEVCITANPSTYVTFNKSSYYYIGLSIQSTDTMWANDNLQVEYRIVGTIRQYNLSTLKYSCFISSGNSTSCTIDLSTFDIQNGNELCILGSIPSSLDGVIKHAMIFYSATLIPSYAIQLYFFLPFIIVLCLTTILILLIGVGICLLLLKFGLDEGTDCKERMTFCCCLPCIFCCDESDVDDCCDNCFKCCTCELDICDENYNEPYTCFARWCIIICCPLCFCYGNF